MTVVDSLALVVWVALTQPRRLFAISFLEQRTKRTRWNRCRQSGMTLRSFEMNDVGCGRDWYTTSPCYTFNGGESWDHWRILLFSVLLLPEVRRKPFPTFVHFFPLFTVDFSKTARTQAMFFIFSQHFRLDFAAVSIIRNLPHLSLPLALLV